MSQPTCRRRARSTARRSPRATHLRHAVLSETSSNALSQVTTFLTYNGNGQPLTLSDPNGVVTTLTYDARLRLKSKQVGTETTSYTYYPTGLLNVVTLPDSSTVQFFYD